MPNKLRFDEALPALANYIMQSTSISLDKGVFVRDGFGRLSFYADEKISQRQLRKYQSEARELLGPLSFPLGAIQDINSPGAAVLYDGDHLRNILHIQDSIVAVNIVERHFFGQDWTMKPSVASKSTPPMMIFCSLKGGVGRSTALFVLSNYLARLGCNILCVDLDLEAPGLAPLLFEGNERPKFGVVDYLVENFLAGVDDDELDDFIGTSLLTDREAGQGRVDLAPATGLLTQQNPENMISKLARALLEKPHADGGPQSLSSQITEFVRRICARSSYDAIFVDARAGLSELTAGPLLGLGGNVLLFATEHPHTFEGYRYLLSHLNRLPVQEEDDWRERISFVHSMASPAAIERNTFNDRLYELLTETFYEQDYGLDAFTFSFDDASAPHSAWNIFHDGRFMGIDPLRDRSLVDSELYKAAFGSFIAKAVETLGIITVKEEFE